jgi:hypothetical protein
MALLFCTGSRYARHLQCEHRTLKSTVLQGVLAQLVERLNGIEEVRGSNPLGSKVKRHNTLSHLCLCLGTESDFD